MNSKVYKLYINEGILKKKGGLDKETRERLMMVLFQLR